MDQRAIRSLALAAAPVLSISDAPCQDLLVTTQVEQTVMRFSTVDGSLMDDRFRDLAPMSPGGTVWWLEINTAPNGEIWGARFGSPDLTRFSADLTSVLGLLDSPDGAFFGWAAAGEDVVV
ncbi:MAG: hypothetical protein AAGG01_14395, partial [Planctomycetota bacterium]